MKKKQLSRRQLGRIHKLQAEHVSRAGEKGDNKGHQDDLPGPDQLGPEQQGLVISHFGQQLDIEALEGERAGDIFRCHQRTNLAPLVAGDRVIWQEGEPYGVVVANQPRSAILNRPSPFGELRPVAANIDTIIIVIAPRPEPFANLIDRYLVAAENIGVLPVILLNKLDLVNEGNSAGLEDLLSIYTKIGYTVLKTSSKSGEGMAALKQMLNRHTSIFVGQSGVGKSALINALLPGVNTLEGSLSEARDKGRHTTTAARLFHLPEGGDLIDSPGIREFGLWHMEAEQLLQGFIEFRPLLGHCRFRDCKHKKEPGCRLQEAVKSGDIDPRRMQSYNQILHSLDEYQNFSDT